MWGYKKQQITNHTACVSELPRGGAMLGNKRYKLFLSSSTFKLSYTRYASIKIFKCFLKNTRNWKNTHLDKLYSAHKLYQQMSTILHYDRKQCSNNRHKSACITLKTSFLEQHTSFSELTVPGSTHGPFPHTLIFFSPHIQLFKYRFTSTTSVSRIDSFPPCLQLSYSYIAVMEDGELPFVEQFLQECKHL